MTGRRTRRKEVCAERENNTDRGWDSQAKIKGGEIHAPNWKGKTNGRTISR